MHAAILDSKTVSPKQYLSVMWTSEPSRRGEQEHQSLGRDTLLFECKQYRGQPYGVK